MLGNDEYPGTGCFSKADTPNSTKDQSDPTKHRFVLASEFFSYCALCDRDISEHLAGGPVVEKTILSADAQERKHIPIATGVLDYFPSALSEIARVSYQGNQQHNPGQPLHWARGKSTDQADCIIRHFLERGKVDSDGMRHSAKLAWRALALLQLELEAEGAPIARGSIEPEEKKR